MKSLFSFFLSSLLFAAKSHAQTDSLQTQPAYAPPQIAAFEAKLVGRNVQLQWTVLANEDVKSFEVEREEAGVFQKIGSKLSLGRTGSQAYDFVDALPKQTSDLVYRLKLLTKDGAGLYSDLRSVTKYKALQCRLKQNPVRQFIDLEIDAASAGSLHITVTTAYGQKSLAETVKLSAGRNTVSVSSQNLLPGLYRLLLQCGNERVLLSFVKE